MLKSLLACSTLAQIGFISAFVYAAQKVEMPQLCNVLMLVNLDQILETFLVIFLKLPGVLYRENVMYLSFLSNPGRK